MGEQTAKAPGLNRAKTYQLVLFPLNNGATNVYYERHNRRTKKRK